MVRLAVFAVNTYLSALAAQQFAAKPGSGAADVREFLEDWRTHVQAAFRDAYRESIGTSAVLPRDPAEEDRLRALATFERLLYEIRYELGHRPELVTVPLADLTALLGS